MALQKSPLKQGISSLMQEMMKKTEPCYVNLPNS